MNRQILRSVLWVCLLLAAAFAGWSWFRPYAWAPDPGARAEVVETLVTRDQTFYWVEIHLKIRPGLSHDLQKPIRLATAAGHTLEAADTTLSGLNGQQITEIWLKFWLEPADLHGPLTLHLNDGKLQIKTGPEIPPLRNSLSTNFTTHHW